MTFPLTYPDCERPFAFEDLPTNDDGKRVEPESWGPIYSKPVKPTHLRAYDPPTNAPSGQKTAHVDDAKLQAKIKAEFAAAAAHDRKAWAADNSREKHAAYAAAPKYKPRKPHYVLRDGEWKLAA